MILPGHKKVKLLYILSDLFTLVDIGGYWWLHRITFFFFFLDSQNLKHI